MRTIKIFRWVVRGLSGLLILGWLMLIRVLDSFLYFFCIRELPYYSFYFGPIAGKQVNRNLALPFCLLNHMIDDMGMFMLRAEHDNLCIGFHLNIVSRRPVK